MRTRSSADFGREPLGVRAILTLAVWFGVLTGLVEVVLLFAAKVLLGRIISVDGHAAWMAPLADVIVFVTVGAILLLVTWRFAAGRGFQAVTTLFAFVSLFAIISLHQRLHVVTQLTAAVGMAVVSAQIATRYSALFTAIVQRSALWLVLVVAALATGFGLRPGLVERSRNANLASPRDGAPNVILIVLDTVRATNLSLYGYARPTTPRLAALGGEGVVFERAIATSSWTLPTHATLFVGKDPGELSINWLEPLDDKYPTLAERFSDHGYRTAAFVANRTASYESGLDQGFARYEDFPVSWGQVLLSSSFGRLLNENRALRRMWGVYQLPARKFAEHINRDFLTWLDRDRSRPFFVFLNYYDAHGPYVPPAPFDSAFGSAPKGTLFSGVFSYDRSISAEERQAGIDAYDGSIAYLDDQLGRLFDDLQRRQLRENTVIVVTSDHGEEFGEHRLFGHGDSLYLPALQVPLLLSYPREVPRGVRVGDVVSLRDVATTIEELAKLDDRVMTGPSLSRFWSADRGHLEPVTALSEVAFAKNLPDWVPVSKGDMKSLTTARWHYIRNGDGSEELYEIGVDALEQREVGASHPDVLTALRAALDRRTAAQSHARAGREATPCVPQRTPEDQAGARSRSCT